MGKVINVYDKIENYYEEYIDFFIQNFAEGNKNINNLLLNVADKQDCCICSKKSVSYGVFCHLAAGKFCNLFWQLMCLDHCVKPH